MMKRPSLSGRRKSRKSDSVTDEALPKEPPAVDEQPQRSPPEAATSPSSNEAASAATTATAPPDSTEKALPESVQSTPNGTSQTHGISPKSRLPEGPEDDQLAFGNALQEARATGRSSRKSPSTTRGRAGSSSGRSRPD